MVQSEFKKILFQLAFYVMACDGELHDKELAEIKSIAEGSIYFDGIDYEKEIGSLIDNFKSHGITSVTNFYKTLETTEFENTEEQHLLEVLIRIVEADDRVDENEVKFISKVRKQLNISDTDIIIKFPKHIDLLIPPIDTLDDVGEMNFQKLDFGGTDNLFSEN